MKKFMLAFLIIIITAEASFGNDGYLWIGGNNYDEPYNLASDCSGIGWEWNSKTLTLSLNSEYTGEFIFLLSSRLVNEGEYVKLADFINLDITGNVIVRGGELGTPFSFEGNINVTGSGTLTLIPSQSAEEFSIPTIHSTGNLNFSGANVIINSYGELNCAVLCEYGDIKLTDNAKVRAKAVGLQSYGIFSCWDLTLNGNSELTAEGEGLNSTGVLVQYGNVKVNDDAKFTAIGHGEGYALDIREGELNVYNDNVNLIADDEEHKSTRQNFGYSERDTLKDEPRTITNQSSEHYSGGGCNSSVLMLSSVLILLVMKYIDYVLKVHSK